jgi:hypothetical protein
MLNSLFFAICYIVHSKQKIVLAKARTDATACRTKAAGDLISPAAFDKL